MENNTITMKPVICDNFLEEKDFIALRDTIIHFEFPWHFSLDVVSENEEKPSPGIFFHSIYFDKTPCSPLYESHFLPILETLNVVELFRIRVNLNPRLPKPYTSDFHLDMMDLLKMEEHVAAQWITSILYINTNNGYTEFEDGTKIESVANRLVSLPLSTRHRIVTQTDEQTRYVVNFNYIDSQNHNERTTRA